MARFTSTTDLLEDSEEWNSGALSSDLSDRVTGIVFSDQAGTLYIEQSADGENWDLSTDYAVTANDGKGFSEELIAPFFRVRFENTGGSTQTAFRLSVRPTSSGSR